MSSIMEFNNTRRNNFLGHDGFIWWIGVVENRKDPLNLGRCQVRIKGLHAKELTSVPTESLPWAQPLFPVNNTFCTPSTLKDGDMVIGFFMDGDAAQFPIIFGMFHGIPEDEAVPGIGFSDQRSEQELQISPRKPKSIDYKTDGFGARITDNDTASHYPEILNEPTIDRLGRHESIDKTIVKTKRDSIVTVTDAVGDEWTEPQTPYDAQYPYNQVSSTESGHIQEFDDTPGAERLHLYHRSGSFEEYHPDGSVVEKVVKDKYTIIMADDRVYVMGNCYITVQGNAKVFVQHDCDLKVAKDFNLNVGGNWKIDVGGNVETNITGNSKTTIGSGSVVDVTGTFDQTSTDITTIKGPEVIIKNG